ncbi:MAG: hypothetical protein HY804_00555 [Nitrospinae bacterium]|nr:hypothetical protein [Nitrospinota bacterium]
MTPHALGAGEYTLLCQLIEKRLGIKLGPGKHYFLEAKLKPLLTEYKCGSWFDLYHALNQDHGHDGRDLLAEAVITNETSWFRDGGPYRALANEVLPSLARDRCALRWRNGGCTASMRWSGVCQMKSRRAISPMPPRSTKSRRKSKTSSPSNAAT